MERRRLALICSHIRQVRPRLRPSESCLALSTSRCDGGGHKADSSKRKDVENSSCVFCSIIRGNSPAFKLYEDDSCLCILDSNPLCHGHSLIIPKLHFSSLEATPPLVVAALCSTVPFLSKAIMKATQCDSFNLVVNSGTAAGQVIFHTHLHIIPRKTNDRLWPSESFRRQPLTLNQDTASLAHRVREQLSFPVEHGDGCETKLAG